MNRVRLVVLGDLDPEGHRDSVTESKVEARSSPKQGPPRRALQVRPSGDDGDGDRTLILIGSGTTNSVRRYGAACHAVLVTSLSGPLARFGRSGAVALGLWAERAGVALEVIDGHPSAAAAIAAAESARPDVVFGPYGSGPAVTAAAASVGVVWNHGGATARLARPAYPRVVNLPSPATSYLAAVLDALVADGLPAGSEIVLFHSDTGFGREVAEGSAVAARRLGLVLHPVSFRPGQGPTAFEGAPAGDVLLSAGSFEDDIVVAGLGRQRRWRGMGLVAAGVEELYHAIGERVEGLYGPCQWFGDAAVEPADGPGSDWFAGRYRDANRHEPAVPGRGGVRCGDRLAALQPRRPNRRSFAGAGRVIEP